MKGKHEQTATSGDEDFWEEAEAAEGIASVGVNMGGRAESDTPSEDKHIQRPICRSHPSARLLIEESNARLTLKTQEEQDKPINKGIVIAGDNTFGLAAESDTTSEDKHTQRPICRSHPSAQLPVEETNARPTLKTEEEQEGGRSDRRPKEEATKRGNTNTDDAGEETEATEEGGEEEPPDNSELHGLCSKPLRGRRRPRSQRGFFQNSGRLPPLVEETRRTERAGQEPCSSASLVDDWDSVRLWLAEATGSRRAACAKYTDPLGRTALHVCCLEGGPVDVVDSLLALAPETALWTDRRGETPLHTVFRRADRTTAPHAARAILERCPGAARATDATGRLAISYLAEQAGRARPPSEAPSRMMSTRRVTMVECSDHYVSHFAGDGDLEDNAAFFKTLDAFPLWLKKHAVLNEQVKNRLALAASKPFPYMVVCCDIMVQAFLLVLVLVFSDKGIETLSRNAPPPPN